MLDNETILIVDYGSQYTQLIARKIREQNVYCLVHPYNKIGSKFLTISQSISILKTHVSGFEYQNNLYGDRELSHSPNQKYTSTLSYDFSKYITGLSLNAESNYVGEFYFEEQNNIKSKPYNLINMSLKYNYKNSTISLWVKNITNKKYAIRGYSFVLDPTYTIKSYQSFGDLRSIGITFNFNIKN